MMQKQTVVVGMSGGVDSSVTALLLKEQGYNVLGLFMKNWEEKDENGACRSEQDFEDVRRVCEQIDIPFYGINFVEDYWNNVFKQFISDFEKGWTPNPDILCNREIKFKVFMDKALELGADFLATGHYSQNLSLNGRPSLAKGVDLNKDQTYFLYTLNEKILSRVLFPIGGLEKSEVRQIARSHHLATSEKKDSTGICFIGKRDFRTFLSQYVAIQPGAFETLQGKKVGMHIGTAYYTLGQRKGLGIGGPGEAWFVVGKNNERGIVYIEQGADHPALYCDDLVATDLTWVGKMPSPYPFECQSKIRYRQTDQPCTIEKIESGKAYVTFPSPQRAATPGQSIVFYNGIHCLGGGIIEKPGLSHYAKQN
ncbi:MAG: tRNA 2-thiouridine(34) synthase MnmA [Candidatus Protochlamydia sp.]|nr:tRNA 2-thiouridine(34) synthase MnmA [Candidatus Protochlamydia sp.]